MEAYLVIEILLDSFSSCKILLSCPLIFIVSHQKKKKKNYLRFSYCCCFCIDHLSYYLIALNIFILSIILSQQINLCIDIVFIWVSLSIFDLWICSFIKVGNFGHYFFKYFLFPFLFSVLWNSKYTYIGLPEVVSQLPNNLFLWMFSLNLFPLFF